MKFKHKSLTVEAFVWNGENVDQLPDWIKQAGAEVKMAHEVELDSFGILKEDMLFYNTSVIDYSPYISKGGILIYDPINGVVGTNPAYFYRNYEPAD